MKKIIDINKYRKVDPDRFKNKKIEYALTDIVDSFSDIRSEFMKEIFELSEGDYLISDESLLSDMFMDWSEEEIRERIKVKYGIEIFNVGSTLICDILSRIQSNKNST